MKNTTELAKQRTRAAAERTLLYWSDSSFKLIGLGIVIGPVLSAFSRSFAEGDRINFERISHLLSLGSILLGLMLLTLGIWQFTAVTRAMQHKNYILLPSYSVASAAVVGIVIFGTVAASVVLLRAL